MTTNTNIQQGYFVSTGTNKVIPLAFEPDWIRVYNWSNIDLSIQWDGVEWFWTSAMNNDDAIVKYHAAVTDAVSFSTCRTGYNGVTYGGIFVFNTKDGISGTDIAFSAGSNATRPVYTTTNTEYMGDGAVVRISNSNHTNLNGLDFTVDAVNTDTNFRLANTLATIPGGTAGAGTYRIIALDAEVYDMCFMKNRIISDITNGITTQIDTLVDHSYSVGDVVRFSVPSVCAMTQLNGKIGTITAVGTATFTVNIDSSSWDTFQFPTILGAYEFAQVIPVDLEIINNTKSVLVLSTLAGSEEGCPGGADGNEIYWIAGKTFE